MLQKTIKKDFTIGTKAHVDVVGLACLYSHDVKNYEFAHGIKNERREVLELDSSMRFRILVQVEGGKPFVKVPEIVHNKLKYRFEQGELQEGEVRCNLYLEESDGSSTDIASFCFDYVVSEIDKVQLGQPSGEMAQEAAVLVLPQERVVEEGENFVYELVASTPEGMVFTATSDHSFVKLFRLVDIPDLDISPDGKKGAYYEVSCEVKLPAPAEYGVAAGTYNVLEGLDQKERVVVEYPCLQFMDLLFVDESGDFVSAHTSGQRLDNALGDYTRGSYLAIAAQLVSGEQYSGELFMVRNVKLRKRLAVREGIHHIKKYGGFIQLTEVGRKSLHLSSQKREDGAEVVILGEEIAGLLREHDGRAIGFVSNTPLKQVNLAGYEEAAGHPLEKSSEGVYCDTDILYWCRIDDDNPAELRADSPFVLDEVILYDREDIR